MTTTAPRRTGRKVAAGGLAAAVLAGSFTSGVFNAPSAEAISGTVVNYHGSQYGNVVSVGVYNGTETYVGGVATANATDYTWCIDWSADSNPGAARGRPLSAASKSTLRDAAASQTNFIIQKYKDTRALHPEIAVAAHQLMDTTSEWDRQWAYTGDTRMNTLRTTANTWIAEARQYAGPYTVTPTTFRPNDRGFILSGVGVKSAAGNFLGNGDQTIGKRIVYYASISGDATFADGTKRATLSANDNPEIVYTGPGEVTLTLSTNKVLPSDSVIRHNFHGSVQNRVEGTAPVAASGSLRIPARQAPEPGIERFIPEVTTQAQDPVVNDDGSSLLKDQLSVRGMPDTDATVESVLWGPFNDDPSANGPQDEVPAGAQTAGTDSTPIRGNGVYETPNGVTVTEPGYYTWTESMPAKDYMLDGTRMMVDAWQSAFGIASETTIVKWRPQVVTQTSHQEAAPGTEITDTLTVSGNRPGQTLDVNSTLYYVGTEKPVRGAEIPEDAEEVFSTTTQVTGNDTVVTDGYTVDRPGYYTWVESIAETDTTESWASDFGIEEETTLVSKFTPQVSTQTSNQNAKVGESIHDIMTVSGNQPGKELNVVSDLYFVGAEKPVRGFEIPESAEKVFTTETKITGNGTFNTAPYVVDREGYYTWVERIDGTDATEPWVSDFGIEEETSLVSKWEPKVTTQTSDQVAQLDSEIHDIMTVTGNRDDHEVTINSTLYFVGDEKPERGSEIPESAEAVFTTSTQLTGNGTVETESYKVDRTGYYTWVESIEGDDVIKPWQSDFGIEEETSLITKYQPEVNTQTSEQQAKVGATIFDTMTVTGNREGQELQIESTLYFVGTEQPVRGSEIPEDAEAVFTTTTPITGNGTVQTEGYQVEKAGYYTWVESIVGTDVTEPWQSDFGIEEETSLIEKWQPEVNTQTSEQLAKVGATIFDTMTVTGNRDDHEVNIESTLYFVGTKKPERGSEIPETAEAVFTTTTPITGNGTVQTEGYQVEQAGYYTWVESIVGDESIEPWQSDFGIEDETSLIEKWQPKVSTETSQKLAKVGASIFDIMTVSDNRDDHEVNIESTLYYVGPEKPERTAEIPESAEAVFTTTTRHQGNGTVETEEYQVEKAGYYTWVESIRGDDSIEPWQSDFGIEEETSLIEKWQPKVNTQTSQQVADIGSQIFDTMTVSDNREGHEVVIASDLYYIPGDVAPERGAEIPDEAEKVFSTLTTAVGNETVQTAVYTVEKPGFYTWVERIEGDESIEPWTSDFGIEEETTRVKWMPQVQTQTSHQVAEPGAAIHDVLTVSGNKDEHELNVESTLYFTGDVKPEVDPEDPKSIPEHAVAVGTVNTSVVGNGTFETEPITVQEDGYYVWVETARDAEPGAALPEADEETEPIEGEDTPADPIEGEDTPVEPVEGEEPVIEEEEFSSEQTPVEVNELDGEWTTRWVSDFGIASETTLVQTPFVPEDPAPTPEPETPVVPGQYQEQFQYQYQEQSQAQVQNAPAAQIISGDADSPANLGLLMLGGGLLVAGAGAGAWALSRKKKGEAAVIAED